MNAEELTELLYVSLKDELVAKVVREGGAAQSRFYGRHGAHGTGIVNKASAKEIQKKYRRKTEEIPKKYRRRIAARGSIPRAFCMLFADSAPPCGAEGARNAAFAHSA